MKKITSPLKKTLVGIAFGISTILSGCSSTKYSIPELEFSNPEEIVEYSWRNIQFKKDDWPGEDWKSVGKTLNQKCGDCEDHAIFASYYLEKLGYVPELVRIRRNDGRLHIATIINSPENKFGIVDCTAGRGSFVPPIFRSQEQAINYYNALQCNQYSEYSIHPINLSDEKILFSDEDIKFEILNIWRPIPTKKIKPFRMEDLPKEDQRRLMDLENYVNSLD